MRENCRKTNCRCGFSLAEAVVALTISAAVLVAMVNIYNRCENAASAVTGKLDDFRLPFEVLQYIAEDVDSSAGADWRVTVDNKIKNGFQAARLVIESSFYNNSGKKQTFEKIVWQSSYDPQTNRLVLYRQRSGLDLEDKLLDKRKSDWERQLFVPICDGVTFFGIYAQKDGKLQQVWNAAPLPGGIKVVISFAEPFKTVTGTLDVAEDEKIVRTIAVNRTRKVGFKIIEESADE